MKKSIFVLYSVLHILIIGSCTTNQPENLRKLGTINFNIGFFPTALTNPANRDTDFIGFADFKTHKQLKIFDLDGNKISSLSLKPLMKKENCSFIAFDFTSLDTIALLGNKTNQVYIINQQSEILEKKDYSAMFLKEAVLFPPFYYKNGQIRTGIVYKDTNHISGKWEEYLAQTQRQNNFFHLMLDNGDGTYQMQLDSLHSRFVGKKEFVSEGNHISYLDTGNIYFSNYNDSLYFFNLKNDLIQSIPVTSKYYKTKVTPANLKDVINGKININKELRKSGFITNLLWDKYRKIYYCFIRGKMIDDELPFSIVFFDKNFKKLQEIKMDYTKYTLSSFVGPKGLYILNQDEDNQYDNRTYTIFGYEQN